MIIELKDTLGAYKPLDVFDDFKITYNHSYEDYSSIEGKKIPYTGKFKIPTTTNNRNLCGVIFDATYPVSHSVDGRMKYMDGTIAFYFIADIEGQKYNVLQPYIEISIVDKLSKAISDLSKYKLSDLFSGETINLANDTWFFGNHTDLASANKTFFFPNWNFNNKLSVFGYDSKRKLCQLQPTFVIHRLLDKIFDYIGLTINSDFLKLDDQLDTGISADELGLMLPLDLRTIDNDVVTTSHRYISSGFNGFNFSYTDRIIGIPSPNATSNRISTSNFLTNSVPTKCLKLNYDWRSDEYWDGQAVADVIGKRFCSTVNGKLKITGTSLNPATKPYFLIGRINSELTPADYFYVTSTGGINNLPQLEVYLVDANMERVYVSATEAYERSIEYDINRGFRVGVANHVGIEDGQIKYEITWDTSFSGYFDVEANENIELALTYKVSDIVGSYNQQIVGTNASSGGTTTFDLIIRKDAKTIWNLVSTNGGLTDDDYDTLVTKWSSPTENQFSITYDFEDYTDIPSGFLSGGSGGTVVPIVDCDIDLGESFKKVNDLTLISVIKMIMQRFNLQFYTDSAGLIWIDTEANRKSNTDIIIDHLIDESVDVNFTFNDNGILTIKDTNPSFYEKDFNFLDKYEVSPSKRDEVSLVFNSAVCSGQMFRDEYDGSGYDLLKYNNDTDYWGTADRKQEEAGAFKPTFCFLREATTNLFFPFNECLYSYYDTALEVEDPPPPQLDAGFLNIFKKEGITQKETKMLASSFSSTSMSLISFEDYEYSPNANNIYKVTWYPTMMDKLNDQSVIMDVGIYVSESDFQKLIDYPNIKYKGIDWDFKGLDDFPISDKNGGITKVKLIKKGNWVYGID